MFADCKLSSQESRSLCEVRLQLGSTLNPDNGVQ